MLCSFSALPPLYGSSLLIGWEFEEQVDGAAVPVKLFLCITKHKDGTTKNPTVFICQLWSRFQECYTPTFYRYKKELCWSFTPNTVSDSNTFFSLSVHRMKQQRSLRRDTNKIWKKSRKWTWNSEYRVWRAALAIKFFRPIFTVFLYF